MARTKKWPAPASRTVTREPGENEPDAALFDIPHLPNFRSKSFAVVPIWHQAEDAHPRLRSLLAGPQPFPYFTGAGHPCPVVSWFRRSPPSSFRNRRSMLPSVELVKGLAWQCQPNVEMSFFSPSRHVRLMSRPQPPVLCVQTGGACAGGR